MWTHLIYPLGVAVIGFFVALLPERLKTHPALQDFDDQVPHILSGLAEFLLSLAFFLFGMLHFVQSQSGELGYQLATTSPVVKGRDLMYLGSVGYLSYFFQPVAWVYLYGMVEGLLRAIEAGLTDRRPGLAVSDLVYRLVGAGSRVYRRSQRTRLLGPVRPDEVVWPQAGQSGYLEVYSAREKPWSEKPYLSFRDELYVLVSKQLVSRGRHSAYQYIFRKLKPGEIIRGRIETL